MELPLRRPDAERLHTRSPDAHRNQRMTQPNTARHWRGPLGSLERSEEWAGAAPTGGGGAHGRGGVAWSDGGSWLAA